MFNYENQGTTTYLVYKLQKEDEVDTLVMGMLTNNKISGIAPVIYTQMDEDEFIKYNVSTKVSAKQMFAGTVDKKHLLGILKGIVEACTSVEDYMIDVSSLLLDWEYIFTDVSTGATSLICLPLKNQTRKNDKLEDMLKTLMNSLQFNHNENCDYIAYILNYLNNEEKFTYAGLKKVLADAESGRMNMATVASQPTASVQPAQPFVVQPTQMYSAHPVTPVQPVVPAQPVQQVTPVQPVAPVQPAASVQSFASQPAQPYMAPVQQAKPIAAPSQRLGASQMSTFAPQQTSTSGQLTFNKNAAPTQVQQTNTQNSSSAGFAIPGQEKMMGVPKTATNTAQSVAMDDVDPNEKEMSMFNLLCHYSKENKEIYKKQQARKKASKAQGNGANVKAEMVVPPAPGMGAKNYAVSSAKNEPIAQPAMPVQPTASAQMYGTQPAVPVQQPAPAQPAAPAQMYGTQPAAPAQTFGAQQPAPAQTFGAQPVASVQPAQPYGTQPAAPAQTFGAQPVAPMQSAQTFGTQPAVPAQTFGAGVAASTTANGANFGETTVLGASNPSFGETTVLTGDGATASEQKAFFVRLKTSEKVKITKSNFRIGKEKSYVDYFIGDNTAVSRSHAEIVRKGGEYFIIDTNSTNHTFVNDIMIQSNVETKLENGSKFKLANEYFEFHYE